MDCFRYKTKMTAYLDNHLSDQERINFELHLSDCPSCRKEIELFRELNYLIDETDFQFAVPNLTGEIMAKIKQSAVAPNGSNDESSFKKWAARKFRSVVTDLVVSAAAAMMLLWFSGPALNMENVSGYAKEVDRISGTIGSVFQSYVRFSATAVDKLSVSVKYVEQIQLKGDVKP